MKKFLSISLYVIAALFLLFYAVAEIKPELSLSEFGRLFLLCGSCVFLYFGGLLLSKNQKNNKLMKINLWIFFILYCILLITFTWFDPMWGRNGREVLNWNKENLGIYIQNSVNLVPFKTLGLYVKEIFSSMRSTANIFFNLFGNVICLMPFGFFLPMLFKKQNKTKIFLFSIISINSVIELVQFVTFTGICDIDDIILNTLGALLMFMIFSIKDVKNLLKNIFLLENNEVDKNNIVKVVTILVIVGVLGTGLIILRDVYYKNELAKVNNKNNFQLQIIDENLDGKPILEKFYEDKLYEYYFSCQKADNVYARINNGEKYLVKDLLNNNPTEYQINIERLEASGLDFIKKEKYEKIEFSISANAYYEENIENNEIFELKSGTIRGYQDKTEFEFFIVPKQTGTTKLTLNIYTVNVEEPIEVREYEIKISEELKVEYREIDN